MLDRASTILMQRRQDPDGFDSQQASILVAPPSASFPLHEDTPTLREIGSERQKAAQRVEEVYSSLHPELETVNHVERRGITTYMLVEA